MTFCILAASHEPEMHAVDSTPDTLPHVLPPGGDTAAGAVSPIDLEKQEAGSEELGKGKEEAPYSVHSHQSKIFIVLTASFAALISPLSASIYWPATLALARDMHVSVGLINLTVTTYMIFQALAPSFIGAFSDIYGRRPAYLICFAIYLGANLGLALQDNYAALMVLRCLQSSGSSGTVALGSAAAADIVTRAERGKYTGWASLGVTLGPALGPVIGGLLDEFLGWRWIFWFLFILSSVFFAIIMLFLPETCRTVVGNGSIPAPTWNRPLWPVLRDSLWRRKDVNIPKAEYDSLQARKKRPSPFAAARIATEKESGLILIYGSLLYAGLYGVMSTLATQLQSQFGFNAVQVGLCYLPLGFGSLTSRWTVGYLTDWNFKREAKRQNLEIVKNRQQDIRNFNIEIARLTITMPLLYAGCLSIIAYGWVMEYRTALAGPLVLLFFVGHLTTGAFSTLSTLVLDTHRQTAATAVAANNLLRCLMGAGATAISVPLIERIGIGWTATFIAGLWVVFSPCLWAVFLWGHRWREEMRVKHRNDEDC